jgi:hypothetical protein
MVILLGLIETLGDNQGGLRQKQNAAFYILAHEIQNSHTGSA